LDKQPLEFYYQRMNILYSPLHPH